MLVSWMGPLTPGLSHGLERSPTPWFQHTPVFLNLNLESPSSLLGPRALFLTH